LLFVAFGPQQRGKARSAAQGQRENCFVFAQIGLTSRCGLAIGYRMVQQSGVFGIPTPPIRRPLNAPMPRSGPRYNEFITSPKVRVIDENGENLGVMLTSEAMEQAAEVGLDLVEVSPNADPPVAKYLDVGKYKYEAQKKANAARKSQKTQEIKEIKMRPNIDDHDLDVKMKKVFSFIEEGDKVKITLRFRGREMSHQQLGLALLQRVSEIVTEVAKVEAYPRLEGRQMLMVLAPK
jgi:translation initiation factor IF-3